MPRPSRRARSLQRERWRTSLGPAVLSCDHSLFLAFIRFSYQSLPFVISNPSEVVKVLSVAVSVRIAARRACCHPKMHREYRAKRVAHDSAGAFSVQVTANRACRHQQMQKVPHQTGGPRFRPGAGRASNRTSRVSSLRRIGKGEGKGTGC